MPGPPSGIAELGAWAPLAYMGLYVARPSCFCQDRSWASRAARCSGRMGGGLHARRGDDRGGLAFLAARYVASDWVAAKAAAD